MASRKLVSDFGRCGRDEPLFDAERQNGDVTARQGAPSSTTPSQDCNDNWAVLADLTEDVGHRKEATPELACRGGCSRPCSSLSKAASARANVPLAICIIYLQWGMPVDRDITSYRAAPACPACRRSKDTQTALSPGMPYALNQRALKS